MKNMNKIKLLSMLFVGLQIDFVITSYSFTPNINNQQINEIVAAPAPIQTIRIVSLIDRNIHEFLTLANQCIQTLEKLQKQMEVQIEKQIEEMEVQIEEMEEMEVQIEEIDVLSAKKDAQMDQDIVKIKKESLTLLERRDILLAKNNAQIHQDKVRTNNEKLILSLILAIKENNQDNIESLITMSIEEKADLDHLCSIPTSLQEPIQENSFKFFDREAFNNFSSFQYSPLRMAIEQKNSRAVELLMNAGASLEYLYFDQKCLLNILMLKNKCTTIWKKHKKACTIAESVAAVAAVACITYYQWFARK